MTFYKGLAMFTMLMTLGAPICGEFIADYNAHESKFIDEREVWEFVKAECKEANLHPGFVYALIYAESGFDAHNHDVQYRGMMGLSKTAWKYVAQRGYHEAYDWKLNVRYGIDYLELLRDKLYEERTFSYPVMAACYYYGYKEMKSANFRISYFESPENQLYRKLMSGSLQPMRVPVGQVDRVTLN